jgi:hypothetical protein
VGHIIPVDAALNKGSKSNTAELIAIAFAMMW